MARPCIPRCVAAHPKAAYFKPRGIPLVELSELVLGVEELEALRLADKKKLGMAEAAKSMGISRHTFGRVLRKARHTVACALVGGYALRIEGGNYTLPCKLQEPPTA